MKNLILFEQFNEAKMSVEDKVAIIKKIFVANGYVIKSEKLDFEDVGKIKMPELTLNLTSKYKDDLTREVRTKLDLDDSPRIEAYPKEGSVYPVGIDLF